ncbi:MAG: hypothetical protein V1685_01725 [Parcubacteria group bacterium]
MDREFEGRLYGKFVVDGPAAIERIPLLYQRLTLPEAYTAFALYCAYARREPYAVETSMKEVAIDIATTVTEAGAIDIYQFVDAIALLETFNNAGNIVLEYGYDTGEVRLDTIFYPMPWLYMALDFVRHFDKERYPLVYGWSDFVLSLPQLLRHQRSLRLGFSDYTQAISNGDFDRWYAQYKVGLTKTDKPVDWRQRYLQQLQRMSDDQLREQYNKCNWGWDLARKEVKNRRVRLGYEEHVNATANRGKEVDENSN